jgi:hypothetical protein
LCFAIAQNNAGCGSVGLTEVERKALKSPGRATTAKESPVCAPQMTEPLGVTLAEAIRISGFSRSELYRRAARGEIIFRKCNARVIVDYATLKAAVAALPIAKLNIAKV